VSTETTQPELPIRELLRQAYAEAAAEQAGEDGASEELMPHRHARSVTVTGRGCADPDAVMDFVEDLPPGVYRVKGTVQVAVGSGRRRFGVQAVGPNVYVAEAGRPVATTRDPDGAAGDGGRQDAEAQDAVAQDANSVLVVIGEDFDAEAARSSLVAALNPEADPEIGAEPGTRRTAPPPRASAQLISIAADALEARGAQRPPLLPDGLLATRRRVAGRPSGSNVRGGQASERPGSSAAAKRMCSSVSRAASSARPATMASMIP
jgi:hypothetical protein